MTNGYGIEHDSDVETYGLSAAAFKIAADWLRGWRRRPPVVHIRSGERHDHTGTQVGDYVLVIGFRSSSPCGRHRHADGG